MVQLGYSSLLWYSWGILPSCGTAGVFFPPMVQQGYSSLLWYSWGILPSCGTAGVFFPPVVQLGYSSLLWYSWGILPSYGTAGVFFPPVVQLGYSSLLWYSWDILPCVMFLSVSLCCIRLQCQLQIHLMTQVCVFCPSESPCAIQRQQTDPHPAGESWRQCSHNYGHLLFARLLQRGRNKVHPHVWTEVSGIHAAWHAPHSILIVTSGTLHTVSVRGKRGYRGEKCGQSSHY